MKDHTEKILAFYRKNKRMPTYSELAFITRYKSKGAVRYYVEKLIRDGFLAKDKSNGRLIPGNKIEEWNEVKVLGTVEAGFPSPAEEELQDTMSFDDYLIPNKNSAYILKVKGDSMIDAGIQDGDMVIVDRGIAPKTGQIVIACVDGENTMKYLRKHSTKGLFLEPANKKYKPIYPEDSLVIEAVVTAVVRKYS